MLSFSVTRVNERADKSSNFYMLSCHVENKENMFTKLKQSTLLLIAGPNFFFLSFVAQQFKKKEKTRELLKTTTIFHSASLVLLKNKTPELKTIVAEVEGNSWAWQKVDLDDRRSIEEQRPRWLLRMFTVIAANRQCWGPQPLLTIQDVVFLGVGSLG